MSDRINLTELRQAAEPGSRLRRHAMSNEEADELADAVLALVEAVEAAQEHDCELHMRLNRESGVVYCRLCDKLARFSFGDTYSPDDHASSQAARRYENHLQQIKDHGP